MLGRGESFSHLIILGQRSCKEKDRNMTQSSGKTKEISLKEISLGDDFGDVAVKVNGVRVEVHTDGSILAYTNRSVDAYTNGPVQVHAAPNDDAKPKTRTVPTPG